jgi:hypothetical protein
MITAIVLSREVYNYRKLAQLHYNLTDEQMKNLDVHHNPPRSSGGRNIPEHLYIYSPENHALVHEDDFILHARKGYELGIGTYKMPAEERSKLAKRIYEEGKALASFTPEERKSISTRAGKISGQLHKERRTGVCGIPPEEHSKRMSETNKQKWICPECGYANIARHVNKHMAEEHNLPKTSKKKMVG